MIDRMIQLWNKNTWKWASQALQTLSTGLQSYDVFCAEVLPPPSTPPICYPLPTLTLCGPAGHFIKSQESLSIETGQSARCVHACPWSPICINLILKDLGCRLQGQDGSIPHRAAYWWICSTPSPILSNPSYSVATRPGLAAAGIPWNRAAHEGRWASVGWF